MAVAGAALSAPIAAAAATVPSRVPEGEPLADRLTRFEDLDAIRALNQAYARHLNAGEREVLASLFVDPTGMRLDDVRGIAADDLGADDAIDVRADRRTATARLHCTVQKESAIGPNCPLVDMARLQGGGVINWTEPVVLETAYVRSDDGWKFERVTTRPRLG